MFRETTSTGALNTARTHPVFPSSHFFTSGKRGSTVFHVGRIQPCWGSSVAASVRALGKEANVVSGGAAMADFLATNARPGDLLLLMSNGSFDGLCERLLKKLGAPQTAPAEANSR